MSFKEQLQFGKVGESAIAQWLIGRGHSVLPVYEQELSKGKGPVLYSPHGVRIAPDMFIFKPDGKAKWIEAKTKTSFTWYRKEGGWKTGIDSRHYYDYLKVAASSPWDVWLLFLHLKACGAKDTPPDLIGKSPVGLFGNELGYLSEHIFKEWDHPPMVYWDIGDLKLLARLEDIPAVSRAV